MTTVHLKYLPISALLTQSIEYLFSVHFPNLSLLDEKFESCTQNKCCKTHCDIMYICVTLIYSVLDFATIHDLLLLL